MPSREYYLQDHDSVDVKAYSKYMCDVALLLGANPDTVEAEMQKVLDFEMKIANVSLSGSDIVVPVTLVLSRQKAVKYISKGTNSLKLNIIVKVQASFVFIFSLSYMNKFLCFVLDHLSQLVSATYISTYHFDLYCDLSQRPNNLQPAEECWHPHQKNNNNKSEKKLLIFLHLTFILNSHISRLVNHVVKNKTPVHATGKLPLDICMTQYRALIG